MLQSNTRMQTKNDLVSGTGNDLRFIGSVQPNRLLPLRPTPMVPRRKYASIQYSPLALRKEPSLDNEFDKSIRLNSVEQLESTKTSKAQLVANTQSNLINDKNDTGKFQNDVNQLQHQHNHLSDFLNVLSNNIVKKSSIGNLQTSSLYPTTNEKILVHNRGSVEKFIPEKLIHSLDLGNSSTLSAESTWAAALGANLELPNVQRKIHLEDHSEQNLKYDSNTGYNNGESDNSQFLSNFFDDVNDSTSALLDEIDCFSVKRNKKYEWLFHRQQLHKMLEKFRLKESSNTKRIKYYSNMLKQLEEADTLSNFIKFCSGTRKRLTYVQKRKLKAKRSCTSVITKTTEKVVKLSGAILKYESLKEFDLQPSMIMQSQYVQETQPEYNFSINENKNLEKMIEKTDVLSNNTESTKVINLKRKSELYSNKYSTVSSDPDTFEKNRAKKVMKLMSVSPPANTVNMNQSTKCAAEINVSQSRQVLQQLSKQVYAPVISSKLIASPNPSNELSATVSHTTTGPSYSQQAIDARTSIPDKPSETIAGTGTLGSKWTDHQHIINNLTSTITDIKANENNYSYQQQQPYTEIHVCTKSCKWIDSLMDISPPASQQKSLQQSEDKASPPSISLLTVTKETNHWKVAHDQEHQALKAQTTSSSDQPKSHKQEISQLYPVNEKATLWNQQNLVTQRITEQVAGVLDNRPLTHDTETLSKDKSLWMQYIQQNSMSLNNEKTRVHNSKILLDNMPKVKADSRKPVTLPQSTASSYIDAEQFPTLGNWVASLVGKKFEEYLPMKETKITNLQPTDQSPSTASQKLLNNVKPSTAYEMSTATSYTTSANKSITGRWTTNREPQPEQTVQPFKQTQVPVTSRFPHHSQNFNPSIPLPYSPLYSTNLYQNPELMTHGTSCSYPWCLSTTINPKSSVDYNRMSQFAPNFSIPNVFYDPAIARYYAALQSNGAQLPMFKNSTNYASTGIDQQKQNSRNRRKMSVLDKQQPQRHIELFDQEIARNDSSKEVKSSVAYVHNSNDESLVGSKSSTLPSICANDASFQMKHQIKSKFNNSMLEVTEIDPSSDNYQKLRCSNCGSLGSRFQCVDCKTAVYCNELCQIQHLSVHVIKCQKFLPKLKRVG